MTTPDEKELRPCPLCGKKAYQARGGAVYFDCDCSLSFDAGFQFDGWQYAWCWKEIDRLKKELSELTTLLATERDRFGKRETELMKELFDKDVERVNKYANAGRLVEWILDEKRKPANTSFTAGCERTIAILFERAIDWDLHGFIEREEDLMSRITELMRYRNFWKKKAKLYWLLSVSWCKLNDWFGREFVSVSRWAKLWKGSATMWRRHTFIAWDRKKDNKLQKDQLAHYHEILNEWMLKATESQRKYEAARDVAIGWRDAWSRLVNPMDEYSSSADLVDEKIEKRLKENEPK